MSRIQHIILQLLFVTGLAAVIAACSHDATDRMIVTVSIEPQRYMLEQIVGDRVQVRSMLADGANPETYDPSMTHMLNLQKSAAYLRMGNLGFEAALLDKIHDSNPSLPIYNTSEGIVPLTGTHSHGPHDDDTMVDPHVWSSVKNARVIARNMLDAMVEIDPEGEEEYRMNYSRFDARLDSLDSAIRAHVSAGTPFLVWHPSLSYFARDYGLRQIVVGGHESKESSVEALRRALDEVGASGATVFFSQPSVDARQVQSLNGQIGAREVPVNLLSVNWVEGMESVADALSANQPGHE